MSDPRNNADDAYAAFKSMGEDEWQGLLRSLAGGGMLQPEEQKGFERALKERNGLARLVPAHPKYDGPIPDYSGEVQAPTEDALRRLNKLVLEAAKLEIDIMKIEADLKEKQNQLRAHKEKFIPELMAEMGMSSIVTATGVKVELKDEVRAAFPKSDQEKRQRAFSYLEQEGDDGIIKRQFVIQYGRNAASWADEFSKKLEELGVAEHATVEEDWSIHHQTLLAYLRGKLKEGANIPMDAFGAVVQSFAKIKLPGV